MIVCTLRNGKGEYISMSGGKTTDWFQASKFPESDVQRRLEYINDEFKLIRFNLREIQESEQLLDSNHDKQDDILYFKGYKPQEYFKTK